LVQIESYSVQNCVFLLILSAISVVLNKLEKDKGVLELSSTSFLAIYIYTKNRYEKKIKFKFFIFKGDVKEIRIIGGHLGPHCWPKAIELISNGHIPVIVQLIKFSQKVLYYFTNVMNFVLSCSISIHLS
jgi:hypothetical protein